MPVIQDLSCVKCGAPLHTSLTSGTVTCPFCGSANLLVPTEEQPDDLICPKCGTVNDADAQHCKDCGTRLAVSCPRCGTTNLADVNFCTKCGDDLRSVDLPQPPVFQRTYSTYSPFLTASHNSNLAVISLVMGLAGWMVLPFICSIIAIIAGNKAKEEIRQSGGKLGGSGMAQAGIVLGYVGVAWGVLLMIFLLFSRLTR